MVMEIYRKYAIIVKEYAHNVILSGSRDMADVLTSLGRVHCVNVFAATVTLCIVHCYCEALVLVSFYDFQGCLLHTFNVYILRN